MTEYSEPELVIPALKYIRDNPGGVPTSQLITHLTDVLRPDGYDIKILSGRRDTHFSQKVRNLTSHGTLEKRRLAKYRKVGRRGIWEITLEGLRYLEDIETIVDDGQPEDIATSLASQGFEPGILDQEASEGYIGIIIEEGALDKRTIAQRSRSSRLRDIALSEFKKAHGERVFCTACGFDFYDRYGEIGKDFIELHHLQPIHLMDIQGEATTIDEALTKVVLLCCNCHRIVHRVKGRMLSVEELKGVLSMERRLTELG